MPRMLVSIGMIKSYKCGVLSQTFVENMGRNNAVTDATDLKDNRDS